MMIWLKIIFVFQGLERNIDDNVDIAQVLYQELFLRQTAILDVFCSKIPYDVIIWQWKRFLFTET